MRATFQSGGPIPYTELREKMQLSRMARPVQVQAQIKKGPAAKRLLASVFFAAGTAYIRARRIVEGVALQYAHRAPSMPRAMLAALTAAILYPIYRWATHSLHGLSCGGLGALFAAIVPSSLEDTLLLALDSSLAA